VSHAVELNWPLPHDYEREMIPRLDEALAGLASEAWTGELLKGYSVSTITKIDPDSPKRVLVELSSNEHGVEPRVVTSAPLLEPAVDWQAKVGDLVLVRRLAAKRPQIVGPYQPLIPKLPPTLSHQKLGRPLSSLRDQENAMLASGVPGPDLAGYRRLFDLWRDLGGQLGLKKGRGTSTRFSVHLKVNLPRSEGRWGSAWAMTVLRDGSLSFPLAERSKFHGPFRLQRSREEWFEHLARAGIDFGESPEELARPGRQFKKLSRDAFRLLVTPDDVFRARMTPVLDWYLALVLAPANGAE